MSASTCITGYTEQQTLLKQLGYAASWLKKIVDEYKTAYEVITACKRSLVGNSGVAIEDKVHAVDLMLDALIRDIYDKYINYQHENIFNELSNSTKQLIAIAEFKEKIPVFPPIEIDEENTSATCDNYDIKMFEQTINELLRNREQLQKIYSKYFKNEGPIVQLKIDITNRKGEQIHSKVFDPVPIVNNFIMRKAKEKMDNGDVVGIGTEPGNPQVPDPLPDDDEHGSGDIPPLPSDAGCTCHKLANDDDAPPMPKHITDNGLRHDSPPPPPNNGE